MEPDIFIGGLVIVLVDEVDLSADTYYYPSSDGIEMKGFDDFSIGYVLSGGVTLTIEAIQDVEAEETPTWMDITLAGYNVNTNVTGNVSFVDVTGLVDFDNANLSKFRIKIVTSDNTNGVKVVARLKSRDK